ncbi:MAG TPA: Ppx/GppA phosphatase family protein [Polyangiaceae bacterium]|nr:Ppx/GppA phosphatase family protein [Polyangiaceae bacterium]
MPASPPRFAAIDIGTNTVLLLVAEASGGELHPVCERATITRLGQGVDASGRLHPDAEARTLACLERYADEARALGAFPVAAVGTSALRDAEGGAPFLDRAEALLGERPRVLSGEDEARLTFGGALSGLSLGGRVAVLDIGGGSTEWVEGARSAGALEVESAHSVNVGAVRLTERFVRNDPPTLAEREAMRAATLEALGRLPGGALGGELVGVAGTVTTLAAVSRGVHPYDGARVHGVRMTLAEVESTLERLASLPLEERKGLPGLDPARADVIVAGAELLASVLGWCGAKGLYVSDRGVRWGLAAERAGLLGGG